MTDESGWGAGFARLGTQGVEVINMAAKGRSSKSFIDEGLWAKALALKGRYYLVQFGHNDEPGKGPERETDPATTFRAFMARYVDESRAIGATPILVTSLVRRLYNEDGTIRTSQTPYVDAVRALAAEKHVPLIDLHAISLADAENAGDDVWADLSPRDAEGQVDRTHLNAKGGDVVGRMVVQRLGEIVPDSRPSSASSSCRRPAYSFLRLGDTLQRSARQKCQPDTSWWSKTMRINMREGLRRELLSQKVMEQSDPVEVAVTDQEVDRLLQRESRAVQLRGRGLPHRADRRDAGTRPAPGQPHRRRCHHAAGGGGQGRDVDGAAQGRRVLQRAGHGLLRGSGIGAARRRLGLVPLSSLKQAPPPLRDAVLKASAGHGQHGERRRRPHHRADRRTRAGGTARSVDAGGAREHHGDTPRAQGATAAHGVSHRRAERCAGGQPPGAAAHRVAREDAEPSACGAGREVRAASGEGDLRIRAFPVA